MYWIRPVASAIALVLLMTSTAAADPSAQQLENNMRASLATIGSNEVLSGPVRSLPSFSAPIPAQVTDSRINSTMAALRRLSSLTGGHSVSVGLSSERQVLGIAHGHTVTQRWTDFHISIGLLTQK
jgi:predicted Zn-dependent protease